MKIFVKITLKLVPVFIALLFTNCHKEEVLPRDYPRINTLEVTDINDTGATFRAEFIYPGNSEISDHGFIWDTNEDLYLLNAEKISLGTASGKGTFKATVNYSLVRDGVYYVKSFAITDKYTVYGKAVKFKSLGCLPPEIFDITPNHGFDGDTIKITGKNFSSLPSNIKVTFGVDQAEIIEADKNEIILLVPVGYTNSGYISVNILVNNFQLEITNFLLDTVKMENIYPQVAKIPNTEIEITCNTLIRNIQNLSLTNLNISEFWYIDNKIFFQIPPDSPIGYVRITAVINNKNVVSTDSLLLISPWVKKTSCPMAEGMSGMYMTQEGFVINNIAYFYAFPVNTYGGKKGEIWEYDPLYDSWNFSATFPDTRQNPFAFAINEKGYFGAGWVITNDPRDSSYKYVFEYAPENKSWTRVQDFPITYGHNNLFGLSTNTDAYVFNEHEYFKYNQTTNTWTILGPYEEVAGSLGWFSTGFEINGKIYIYSGWNSNKFWCYNSTLDNWSIKSDIPSESREWATGFSINGKGYIVFGRTINYPQKALPELWMYDPENDTWKELANFPNGGRYGANALVINGKAYIANDRDFVESNFDHELWEFNPDF